MAELTVAATVDYQQADLMLAYVSNLQLRNSVGNPVLPVWAHVGVAVDLRESHIMTTPLQVRIPTDIDFTVKIEGAKARIQGQGKKLQEYRGRWLPIKVLMVEGGGRLVLRSKLQAKST